MDKRGIFKIGLSFRYNSGFSGLSLLYLDSLVLFSKSYLYWNYYFLIPPSTITVIDLGPYYLTFVKEGPSRARLPKVKKN